MQKIFCCIVFQFLISVAIGQSFNQDVSREFIVFKKEMDAEGKSFFKDFTKRNIAQNINSAFTRIDQYEIISLKFYQTICQLRDHKQDLTLQEYEFVDSLFKVMLDIQETKHNAIILVFDSEDVRTDVKEVAHESVQLLLAKIYEEQHEWLVSEIIKSGYKIPREKLPYCDGSLKFILFEEQRKK